MTYRAEPRAELRAEVPATTSNLGPGFDCLGMALDWCNVFRCVPGGDGLRVQLQGEGAELLPAGPSNLWWALAADRRLNREWDVYGRLSPTKLTPAPVWRTHDAIMCTYFDGQSVSKRLAAERHRFWDLMKLVLLSLRRLHDHGATHMDAKVENILTDAEAWQFVFIDFDCTPPKWVEPPQQRAYDYLKLIDSSLRLVPPRDRENRRRWIGLLERTVDEETRQTNLDLLPQRRRTTRHIMRDPHLCRALRCVFHRL